ncbi:hypothetical protein LEL_10528 [Akanthomyces lecanii RCEF 1005]|uniref:Uncharacterized protein n=1 Tax=Akanthomyces lecanii RCEF 1005 TaxID=1081108 RepID=A0A167XKE0_CORDF|nr:hypothetical protein LEL_10528 [Akanthomyces lecanii RCEF 1005]
MEKHLIATLQCLSKYRVGELKSAASKGSPKLNPMRPGPIELRLASARTSASAVGELLTAALQHDRACATEDLLELAKEQSSSNAAKARFLKSSAHLLQHKHKNAIDEALGGFDILFESPLGTTEVCLVITAAMNIGYILTELTKLAPQDELFQSFDAQSGPWLLIHAAEWAAEGFAWFMIAFPRYIEESQNIADDAADYANRLWMVANGCGRVTWRCTDNPKEALRAVLNLLSSHMLPIHHSWDHVRFMSENLHMVGLACPFFYDSKLLLMYMPRQNGRKNLAP